MTTVKWIEVIQLRATGRDKELLGTELVKLIEENSNTNGEHPIMAYNRVLVDTDFKIQIVHETENVEKNGSPLGIRLVSALESFGMVNHSMWVELKDTEGSNG